jgi:hypothetical protein
MMVGADISGQRAKDRDDWSSLLREAELPLTPGFMTAGYTALGRYVFLATEQPRSDGRTAPAVRKRPTLKLAG